MTTSANDMREALARVVTDQRRDADLIVNDIIAVLRDAGSTCWYCPECQGVDSTPHGFLHSSGYDNPCTTTPVEALVLPMPDQEPT